MTTSPNPVTRVAVRKARTHCEQAYETLVGGMIADMRGFPGFVSGKLIPPAGPGGDYQVITEFASAEDLERWDRSDIHLTWLQRLETVAEGDPDYRVLTGLEAWFAPSTVPANAHPPRGRMTFVSWLGIFPTVSLLLAFVAPWLAPLPFLLRSAIFTGLVALLMSYVVMPRLTRWMKPFLLRK